MLSLLFAQDIAHVDAGYALRLNQCPKSTPSLAAFQVIIIGRFWVIPEAGYSRGAFYSNFADKDELFLDVIDAHRLDVVNALHDIFRRISGDAEQLAAVREWFTHQWRMKDSIVLRMEFSRRAMKNRSVRKRLADLWRQEFESYAACVAQAIGVTPAGRPETVALALVALIHGLGSIAVDTSVETYHLFDDAAKLVFDRLSLIQCEDSR